MGETSTNTANINMLQGQKIRVEEGCVLPEPCDAAHCPDNSHCSDDSVDDLNTHTCVCDPGEHTHTHTQTNTHILSQAYWEISITGQSNTARVSAEKTRHRFIFKHFSVIQENILFNQTIILFYSV